MKGVARPSLTPLFYGSHSARHDGIIISETINFEFRKECHCPDKVRLRSAQFCKERFPGTAVAVAAVAEIRNGYGEERAWFAIWPPDLTHYSYSTISCSTLLVGPTSPRGPRHSLGAAQPRTRTIWYLPAAEQVNTVCRQLNQSYGRTTLMCSVIS